MMNYFKILTLLCMSILLSCNNQKPIVNDQNSVEKKSDSSFFPIAVWLQNPNDAIAYKSYGINMYVGIWGGLDQSKLDLLKAAGMKVIADQNEFGLNNLNETLIYGWMHGDEPDNAQWNSQTNRYDPCVDPAKIIEDYHQIKSNDPSRPVYLNLGRGVAVTNWVGRGDCTGNTDMYKISNDGYLKGCDIASFDVYPVNSDEPEVQNNLWYVAKGIDNLLEWSDNSLPVWCWIETTKIGDEGFGSRKPTPSEVKSQVWMALVHGASGVGYFCHSFVEPQDPAAFLHDEEMISAMKDVNLQIAELAPVLNSPTINGFASVISDNHNIPIDILTKKVDDAYYIFSVAMRTGKSSASFTVTEGQKVEVIGENREIDIDRNGKFIDEFSDYEVHLYKITSKN